MTSRVVNNTTKYVAEKHEHKAKWFAFCGTLVLTYLAGSGLHVF
jgi:hypothetical protein